MCGKMIMHCYFDSAPRVRLSTYGGHAFCYAGPSAWNVIPDIVHFLWLFFDLSLNISTSHIAVFEVLQVLHYVNYLLNRNPLIQWAQAPELQGAPKRPACNFFAAS